ncbi:hypothetical protein [Nocardia terpenica]|uniref:Uncharacterized protein n=1 Tax=Nocardia terpenica TaxID=455432 RepID=A0A6G9YZD2_9NOCA|nr:hypothetical protein [Nocardia terpenica]QIS18574.1 hypothetical protein F6W96_09980 [Nocardia terpenica]
MTGDPRDVVIALLQLAQSYDCRNIDGLMADSWLDAAHRAQWKPEAAAEAIREHYAESTDRIMPGHITARINADRKAPRYRPELPTAPPATAEQRAAARALYIPTVRTHGPRQPVSRRRWVSEPSTMAESGGKPIRAFSGDLGTILGQLPSNGRE